MELRMSQKERDRIKVLEQLKVGLMGQRQAAELLKVSERQVRRLAGRYAAEGDAGLVHRGRGKPSNRKIAAETKERALEELGGELAGFGPTLASEMLAERHGIEASRETVRGWIAQAGTGGAGRKKRPHRKRRERRPCFGELVQMDSSEHDWLEGRGPRMTLVTTIDDATGFKRARFHPSDTGQANREEIKAWIEAHGRPMALYTDRATHFHPTEIAGVETNPTQIGRALEELGIELIAARSPQAKGRVERSHGIDQERLIKEMRLERIATIEAANAFLAEKYLPKVNGKFAVRPREAVDAHRGTEGMNLEAILSEQEPRTVASDWTISVDGRHWQIEEEATKGMPPRAKVTIERRLDGTTRVRWGDRYLSYRLLPPRPPRPWSRFDDDEEGEEILRLARPSPVSAPARKGQRRPKAPPGPSGRGGVPPYRGTYTDKA